VRKGCTVCLTGANVAETVAALTPRVLELGRTVERVDDALAQRLGSADATAHVCHLLARNGVVVVATYAGADPSGECLHVNIAPHDTPDFAAEKILDDLAEADVLDIDTKEYSPEEELRIRERLADLGYIE